MTRLDIALVCALLLGAFLVSGILLFIGRWQIAASTGDTVYRLDRWTGEIDLCSYDVERMKREDIFVLTCPAPIVKMGE